MGLYDKITPNFLDESVPITYSKIILFDPSEIYSRINIEKYARRQRFYVEDIFPSPEGKICACGCLKKLTGRQTRWANTTHADVPVGIHKVICGDLQYIKKLMMEYLPYECAKCHCESYVHGKNWSSGLQVDHIIGIKQGGGGCWLGNYQFLCHRCHAAKTHAENFKKQVTLAPLYRSTLFD